MRVPRCVLTLAVALGLLVAWAVPALADDPTLPVLGFTFDPLSGPDSETVLDVQQPNWANPPIYDRNFGSGLAQTTPGGHESITVGGAANGSAYVYVVSPKTKQVSMYDAVTLAFHKSFGRQVQGPQYLNDPVGAAYYRDELYVLDRYRPYQDHARIVVYDWDGNFQREIPLFNPLGQVDLTGIDLAWGEAWVTGEVCGGLAGVVEILDAQTGVMKAVSAQLAHAPTGDPTHLCDETYDSSAWWDISLIPESGTGIAGYRMIDRWGGVSLATAADAEPLCYLCYRPLWEGGSDSVWGMRWFLSVDGGPSSVPGSEVTEYSVEPNQAGHPYLQQRRQWHPKQTTGISDIVYQNREVRIDWNGHLTTDNWMRGRRCLSYVVSDADFFAAGDQVEHWWEQARNFQSAVVKLDGAQATLVHPDGTAVAQPLMSAADTICVETSSIPSGTHSLAMTATVAGAQQVTATNPTLNIDHTLPDGTVTYPGKVLRDTVTVAGTLTDQHSGPRDWELTEMPLGSSIWTSLCAPTSTPYQCSWPTAATNPDGSRTYPDGKYYLRAHLRDAVTDPYGGPNEADSPLTAGVIVDNTPPTFTLTGPLSPGAATGTLADGRYALNIAAADGNGSGVSTIQVFVDGTQRDSISQPCADYACTLSRTYTLRTDDYSEGSHTVRVVATDFAGFTREQSWSVDTRNKPTLSVSGPGYSPGGPLADGRYGIHVDAQDGDSGVKQIAVSVDGVNKDTVARTCDPAAPVGSCPLSRDYTLHTDDYSEGIHSVSVVVTDQADHTNQRSWEVTTQNKPILVLSGDLRDAADGRPLHPGEIHPLSIAARDADSGAKSAEVLVDGVRADYVEQACPGGGCALTYTFNFMADPYAQGDHQVMVVARDQAGYTSSEAFDVEVEKDNGVRVDPAPADSSLPSGAASASVKPSTSTTSPTDGLLPCTSSQEPANFPVFSLGPSFEGLPVTYTERECKQPYPGEPVRANLFTYLYGDCTPNPYQDGGCTVPIEVQSWPACERNLSSYVEGPGLGFLSHDPLEVQGTTAALFDGGTRLEVYTGTTTIVIFGSDPAQVRRAADVLREEPLTQPPGSVAGIPAGTLPDPPPGTLTGDLDCADAERIVSEAAQLEDAQTTAAQDLAGQTVSNGRDSLTPVLGSVWP